MVRQLSRPGAPPTPPDESPPPSPAWFSLRSLRGKLQVFALLLVLVPGALLAVIAYVDARSALEVAVGRQLSEVAHDALVELEEALAGGQSALREWAAQDVMRDVVVGDLDKRISRSLHGLTAGGGTFRDLVCVDRDGHAVAASDPRWLNGALAGRESVRAALAGREFMTGVPSADDGGQVTVEIAVPIPDPERPHATLGALVGWYDWGQAMARAERIRRTLVEHGLTLEFLVLDGTGALIGEVRRDADPQSPADDRRVAAATAVARSAAAAPRGVLRVDAAHSLLGYERAADGSRGWLVAATEPLSEAFAPIAAMRRRLTAAIAAVLLVALALATAWATRLARPLRELTNATRTMARAGEVPGAVAVRSHDEIGVLAGAFNAMASALARAREDLLVAAKFAFVGEVAAGIAHEVRTPLGILRGSAQMLLRSMPPDYPEGSELACMIVEEVDRLDRVVAGLLELARPRAPLFEPTSLAVILDRAIDFLERPAHDKAVRVTRALDAPLPPARCDPDHIYQVALNLILNAIQMVPSGGHVTVRTRVPGPGRVAFEVTDDGPGIPPELRERIFTPFFSAREGGTGLGLALVQRMVQAHGGTVSVDSTVGRGTTFRVVLPVDGVAG